MGDFDKRVIKDHKGRVYPTVAAMCRAWGVQKATYLWRMCQGWGLERSLTAGKGVRSRKAWVDPLGNSYDTCADMCQAWGVKSTSTYYRNSRKGGGGEKVA